MTLLASDRVRIEKRRYSCNPEVESGREQDQSRAGRLDALLCYGILSFLLKYLLLTLLVYIWKVPKTEEYNDVLKGKRRST